MTDKFPLGRGRGSLLDVMRQREQEKRRREHSVETPSQSSSDPTRSFEGHSLQSSTDQTRSFEGHLQSSFEAQIPATVKGRGRANLASLVKLRSNDNVLESQQIKTVGQSRSTGRGTLLGLLSKQTETSASTSSSAHTSAFVEKDSDGVLGALADLTVYDNPPSPIQDVEESDTPICRQGISGKTIYISANYINVELEPGRGLFQYEVKFSPDIDARGLRRSLLNQHASQLGREKTFDGAILFLPMQLPEKITKLCSVHPVDGSNVTLTVIYKKKQSMSENVQFFNILFGRIMRALSLVRIGRQNFNPTNPHFIDEHQLEVWPGYVTAINEYEGGLKLCLDIKHRVLRTQTVRDIMTDMYHRQRNNYRDCVMKEIVGTSVLTRYNNRTYRIDDIAWDKTPEFKFSKNGEEISLIDYYKTYCGIEIKDMTQPLLVHRATERTPIGEKQEKILLLIPELSYISGLTDSIRSNYKIMKDLDVLTKVSPGRRCDEIKLFVETIQQNEVTRQMLAGWGLRLNKDVVQFSARTLESEKIYFANNKYYQYTDKPDWISAAARNPVLRTPHLNRWYILYINKDENIVRDFLSMLQNITKAIGMRINNPQKIILRDEKNESYLREIRGNFNKDYELVVAVFPTNRTDRYNSLKRLCCVEKPIASQVILTRTLANPSKLKNVTEKIALQINCKLGGALWTVTMPLKNCMVCGIDVYHAGIGSASKRSVAGFVASLDAQMTKWHSKVCMQASKQELMDMLQMCLISAIKAFRKHNDCNPERIIIYRDGVGDGDLDYVVGYEVKQLLMTFNRIDPNYKPQLSVIVVQKRINTRLFMKTGSQLINPPAGTVIDSCITRRNYYDFFLVPQNVRQGSVSPIHYIVIYDSSTIKTDHMQRITYKLCHLYYNWSGTIRVPAPCQYAHKLVYQVGQSLQVEPHSSLEDVLFYL